MLNSGSVDRVEAEGGEVDVVVDVVAVVDEEGAEEAEEEARWAAVRILSTLPLASRRGPDSRIIEQMLLVPSSIPHVADHSCPDINFFSGTSQQPQHTILKSQERNNASCM